MSDYIENGNYISKSGDHNLDSAVQINRSSELDEIAEKLDPNAIAHNADTYLTNEGYRKTRVPDFLSGLFLLFQLIKTSNNKPIYMLMDHYDWQQTSGFYFFIGTHDEIKQKLLKLWEDSDNRKKNPRWH